MKNITIEDIKGLSTSTSYNFCYWKLMPVNKTRNKSFFKLKQTDSIVENNRITEVFNVIYKLWKEPDGTIVLVKERQGTTIRSIITSNSGFAGVCSIPLSDLFNSVTYQIMQELKRKIDRLK